MDEPAGSHHLVERTAGRPRSRLGWLLAVIVGLGVVSAPSTAAAEPDPAADTAATGTAATDASAAAVAPVGAVNAVAPVRLVDTRSGLGYRGSVPAGGTLTVPVTGRAGVPASGVEVVVLTVVVPAPTVAGTVTSYPSDGTPSLATVRYTAGRTVSTQIWVPVARDGAQAGSVTLRNNGAAAVPMIVDVTGWTAEPVFTGADQQAEAAASPSGRYVPVTPTRLTITTVAAGGSLVVPVTGRASIPAGARGALLSVSAVAPRSTGWLTARAADRPAGASAAASLNWSAGVSVTGPALVPLSAAGTVALDNRSSTATTVQVDVVGWVIGGDPTAGGLAVLPPTRVVDTRSGLGLDGRSGGAFGPGLIDLTLTGKGGVPATGVAAVAVQLTVVDPTRDGYLRLAPSTTPRPAGVTVNFPAGGNRTGSALVPLDSNGQVRLENPTLSVQHVVVDVVGYLPASPATGDLQWTGPTDTVAGLGQPIALSCPPSATGAASFCLTVGTTGWATRTGTTWTAGTGAPPVSGRDSVSCASATYCMAVGGNAVSLYEGATWRPITPPTADLLSDISCYRDFTCLLAAPDGRTWAWTGASWSRQASVFTWEGDDPPFVGQVSCVSEAFCGAVGTEAWFYRDGRWGGPTVLQNSDKDLISCPVAGFCGIVGAGGSGLAVYRDGVSTEFEEPRQPRAVSCTDASFCVAVGLFNQESGRSDAITLWSGSAWSEPFGRQITVPGEPVLVSCPNRDLCVSLQDDGRQILGTRT